MDVHKPALYKLILCGSKSSRLHPHPFVVIQTRLILHVLHDNVFFLIQLQYLFSAILGRDQVYQNILDQGMLLGLPWGSDLVTGGRASNNTSTNSRVGSEEGGSVPEASNN